MSVAHRVPSLVFSFVLVANIALAGCTPSSLLGDHTAKPASASEALGEEVCKLTTAVTSPLVVDMKDHDRAALEVALRSKAVVFSYDCTTLRLLPACSIAEGGYAYTGITKKETLLELSTSDEVRANLPSLGTAWAAKLSAELNQDTSLDIALVTVGQQHSGVARLGREELVGQCDGATHFVRHAHVGAFVVEAGSSAAAKSVVEIFEGGAGVAASRSKLERIRDGELKACNSATSDDERPPEGCGAILRVELVPITDEAEPTMGENGQPVCPGKMVFVGGKCAEGTPLARCVAGDASLCKQLCGDGDQEACVHWGVSELIEKNHGLAVSILKKACEKGHPNGCDLVGHAMRDVDLESALPYFERGCQLGSFDSCTRWASDLIAEWARTPTLEDRKRALGALRRACHAAGYAHSCVQLAGFYLEPDPAKRVVEPNEQEALRLYLSNCVSGGTACGRAAMLLEGRDWCQIDRRDPQCKPFASSHPVKKNVERAIRLYARGCSRSFREDCASLLRLGAGQYADATRLGHYESECGRNETDHDRRTGPLWCAVAGAAHANKGRGDEALLRFSKSCSELSWIERDQAEQCASDGAEGKPSFCRDANAGLVGARYACTEQDRLTAAKYKMR